MLKFGKICLAEKIDHIVIDLNWVSPEGNIDDEFLTNLAQLLNYLEDRSLSKVVVFRGFPNEISNKILIPDIDCIRRFEKILAQISHLPAVTIAVIEHACIRFVLQLSSVCDYRLATSGSIFMAPEIKEGYLPGMAIFRVSKLVGVKIARKIFSTGTEFGVEEAKQFGFLDYSSCPEDLDQFIIKLVDELMPYNPTIAQLSRRLLNESFIYRHEEAIGNFMAAQHVCLNELHKDSKETYN